MSISRVLSFLKKKWWLIALILIVVAGGFWYSTSQKNAQKPTKTVQPVMKDLKKTLDFTGRVDAQERVSMFFAGGGKLVYVGAKEGDTVKKYQTLASIDRRAVEKNLERQLSLYQDERWSYENSSDDREDRTLSESERRLSDQDQFTLNRAVIDVELKSLAIEDTRLTSPIEGVLVSAPNQVVGGPLLASDRFEVINPKTLYFRLLVDEVDIDQVALGQQATVRLDARPDQPLNAVVEKIAYQSIETAIGTVFPVEIKFVDAVSLQDQRVGMNGDAELLLAEAKNVMTVPLNAVSTKDGKQIVRVMVGEVAEDRVVELGLENDNDVEIKSGLSLEDRVVLP